MHLRNPVCERSKIALFIASSRVTWHGLRIVLSNYVFHAIAVHENIVHKTNALTHDDKVEVIGEEVVFNTREPDQPQKAAMVRPSVILAISHDRLVVPWSSTQEAAAKSVTLFQFEHVWRDGMVKEVLTDMGMVDSALKTSPMPEIVNSLGVSNTPQEIYDFLLLGFYHELLSIVIDHDNTSSGSAVDENTLFLCPEH
jgi:hypothetical protein